MDIGLTKPESTKFPEKKNINIKNEELKKKRIKKNISN